MTDRSGYAGKETHEYVVGDFTITCMGDDRWYIFDAAGNDIGHDFPTLRAARKWVNRKILGDELPDPLSLTSNPESKIAKCFDEIRNDLRKIVEAA